MSLNILFFLTLPLNKNKLITILSDLPRGQIKNNSMRKLAAKTLMEILPENISKVVHQKLEQQGVSPEFLTLVGMVSYYAEEKNIS